MSEIFITFLSKDFSINMFLFFLGEYTRLKLVCQKIEFILLFTEVTQIFKVVVPFYTPTRKLLILVSKNL